AVAIDTTPGAWSVTAVRPHQNVKDHTDPLLTISATLTVSSQLVTELRLAASPIPQTVLHPGDFFYAAFLGLNLDDHTWFDVRFRRAGRETDEVALNWQGGATAWHELAVGLTPGTWTFTGVWAHQDPGDHSTDFVPVSGSLNLTP